MAQIFVSHSQRDNDDISFLLKAFAGTNVKPILQEFEKEPPAGITAQAITQNIERSNAVFVLLSENVQNLPHTRDWVTWECGAAKNKETWVLEPAELLGNIKVVVPHFNHYVRYLKNDDWRKYLRSVIESYDDSHIIPTLSAATVGGAALDEEDRGGGAAVGFFVGVVGLLLHSAGKQSFGIPVRCWKCPSTYRVHSPDRRFRCPNCNADSVLNPPPQGQQFVFGR